MTKDELLEQTKISQKMLTDQIAEYLKAGKSFEDIAELLGITAEDVIFYSTPPKTLEELNFISIKSKYVLFLIVEEDGKTQLVSGNDQTLMTQKPNAQIFIVGIASPGVKEGVIGTFVSINLDIFNESPEIK
jgi:hypothetical protein